MQKLTSSFVLLMLFVCGNASAKTVAWGSDEGIARLEQSQYKVDFFVLANQFENQTNKAFCGPTSVAIVLNALRLQNSSVKKPKDESLVEQSARRYLADPIIERYTPNTAFIPKNARNTASTAKAASLDAPRQPSHSPSTARRPIGTCTTIASTNSA